MTGLKIGDKYAAIPIIQGGMGVGVSRSRLAGAVAKEGGIGVISSAQIGYDEDGFERHPEECNLRALKKHIRLAKEIAGGVAGKSHGLVGVNVMVALKNYKEHVRTAARSGADLVICGAGLPMDLPLLVEGTDCAIAPIVSSARAADLILKTWDRKYQRTADLVVIEGPKAGGHLGFKEEDVAGAGISDAEYDEEIRKIIACLETWGQKYGRKIPAAVAGGIFDRADIDHALALGADAVQIASRFVATEECDAADAYKQAYINAGAEDIRIIKSPVGMPGRALYNGLLRELEERGRIPIRKCYGCIKKCHPAEVPYCITKALIRAVEGDVEGGLIFCGANVGRIDRIVTVRELMRELTGN
ncbi:MAG: nitronate monooxygenase family protein [Lachnospiraceae bacterium]|nr:nitronate monooxygenase family protein [Lachnospiraceae bacterium]